MDAADCKVSDTRRLSWYTMEHIFTLPNKTPLLPLIRVADDAKQFSTNNNNKSNLIQNAQHIPRRIISGKEYYQFRCRISDVGHNEGVISGFHSGIVYTEKKFRGDVKSGNGGFKVTFDGYYVDHHFNWRQILKCPSSLLFFGAPLSMCRLFDNIFK